MSKCPGCFPIYQANQEGHMGSDGCLGDFEFCPSINLENTFDMIASESTTITSNESSSFETSTDTECCICFETIGEKNNCTTDCGHKFCFKCLATAMTRSNACPCCRAPLIEENEESDDEYQESDDEDNDEEYNDEDEDEDDDEPNRDYKGNIEDIVKRLEKSGITLLDVASLLFNKFSKTDSKYSNEYVENLCKTIDQINEDAEQESFELEQMENEDIRV